MDNTSLCIEYNEYFAVLHRRQLQNDEMTSPYAKKRRKKFKEKKRLKPNQISTLLKKFIT